MKTVKVKREDLLSELIKNRSKHEKNVTELKYDRTKAIIDYMEECLEDYQLNGTTPKIKDFPNISSNVESYSRAIRMMELSVDEEIELTESEFDQYVMDNWSFNHDLLRTATFYGKALS